MTTPSPPDAPVATTKSIPPPTVAPVDASSRPHGASQPPLVEDDLATLNQIEASRRFGIDAQGRIPVLLALSDELAGLDRSVVYPAAETGYVIGFGNTEGPLVTAAGTAHEMSIGFTVTQIDDDTRESQQQFLADHNFQTVTLGPTVAWVGSDATPRCPPAPEDGYDTTVLSWYDAGLVLALEISPIPECEPGAISLQQAIEIARGVAACSGFELAAPDCKPLYG